MKRLYIIIAISVIANTITMAQNISASDMLRFSQNYPWGTARAMGLNGAFGALGADQTSMSINPAGIGFFRTSDFAISLSHNSNTSVANWGTQTSDFTNKLNIGNIGYVYTSNLNKDEGLISVSLGLAFNRLNDFNRTAVMKNPIGTSSLLDEFVYYANGEVSKGAVKPVPINDLYEFYEGLAHDNQLLFNDYFSDDSYASDFTVNKNSYGHYQERKLTTKGGIGEYAFSIAGNYSNMLYLGATIGIQRLKYEELYNHYEDTYDVPNFPNLRSFTFSYHNKLSGTGVNIKLGGIIKPVNFLRLGLAIHTPTFYNIDSEFYTNIDAYFKPNAANDPTYSGGTQNPPRIENNTLNTPWKAIGSLALVFPRFGLLSVDYERLNYQNAKLSGDNINFQNEDVKDWYNAVNNIKIGAEIKVLANVSLRGGYGIYSTPFKDADLKSLKTTSYSGGIGFRGKTFYIDFAYVAMLYPDKYTLYNWTEVNNNGNIEYVNNPTIADINYQVNRFVATLGFRF